MAEIGLVPPSTAEITLSTGNLKEKPPSRPKSKPKVYRPNRRRDRIATHNLISAPNRLKLIANLAKKASLWHI